MKALKSFQAQNLQHKMFTKLKTKSVVFTFVVTKYENIGLLFLNWFELKGEIFSFQTKCHKKMSFKECSFVL